MQRATSFLIFSTLVLPTAIAPSAQANGQDLSNSQMQNGRQQIESTNQPQGCTYIPGYGRYCW